MQIHITGRHITLTNAIKNYAIKKFEKLNDYFDFRESGELHITIEVQKYRHIAEGILRSKQHEFTAKVETKDMYSSIDMLEAKLLIQIKKHKERLVKGERVKNKKINLLANISTARSMKGEKYNEIIEEDMQATKPMNTEEAIEELSNIDDKIMLFYNVDFNKVCLIRKRKDGKFGLTISKFK